MINWQSRSVGPWEPIWVRWVRYEYWQKEIERRKLEEKVCYTEGGWRMVKRMRGKRK